MKNNLKKLSLLLLLAIPLLAPAQKKQEPPTRLDITSQPQGATVRINHQERGTTPLTLNDLPPGTHLMQLSLPGCKDAFDTTTLESGVTRTAHFNLEHLTGILLITSEPTNSEISYNGVSLGTTPRLITSLESGVHRLTLSAPGFQTKEFDVELEGRIPARYDITLMSDSGTLNLTSQPPSAEVLINGIARGTTPCRIERIPGGAVTVELRVNGYQPHKRDISLAAGEVQDVNVTLTPKPGTLRVETIPPAARLYLNNEYKGETPFELTDLAPDTYRIRVEKSGHEPTARNVTIGKGISQTEEFRLIRNTGRIELITAPASATILIDGQRIGETTSADTSTTAVSDPYAIEDVMEGEHEIEVFRKGYATLKRPITVKRGETLTLQFRLIRQFIPNYEVTTTRSYYRGVLDFINEEGIRLETAPGITQTIPMKDVRKHGPLREEE